jgi:hypothetical protein
MAQRTGSSKPALLLEEGPRVSGKRSVVPACAGRGGDQADQAVLSKQVGQLEHLAWGR